MPTSSPRAGRSTRMAIAAAALVASVALTGCSQVLSAIEQVIPEPSGVHRLAVGECFNNTVTIPSPQDAVVDVPRQNCTLDHDNEIFASTELDGKEFPGDDAVSTQAQESCLAEFEAFVGVPQEEAGTLRYDFFAPSAASWLLGDREVLCFAYDSATQTAYTLEGAGGRLGAETEPTEG